MGNLASNLTTALSYGINYILEGVVPFYEIWDVRYGVTLWDATHIRHLVGRRRGIVWSSGSLAVAPEYTADPGFFGDLPVMRWFNDGSNNRVLGPANGGLVFPVTNRPHLMIYGSAQVPGALSNGVSLSDSSNVVRLSARYDTTNRVTGRHSTTAGNISVTSPINAYVTPLPFFLEHYRTATDIVAAINGVTVATAAQAANYSAAFDGIGFNTASPLLDQKIAIVVVSGSLIPDPQRAEIQAFCEDFGA